jgi:hypothetical protein
MQLTKKMAAKSTVVSINCRNSDTFYMLAYMQGAKFESGSIDVSHFRDAGFLFGHYTAVVVFMQIFPISKS